MGQDVIELVYSKPIENPVSKVFAYDGANVTFSKKGDVVMVNATEMAKKFIYRKISQNLSAGK